MGAYGNTQENSLTSSTVVFVSGDGQSATEGTALPQPLMVRIQYQTNGLPAEGVQLTCSVLAGGGTCPAPVTTNAQGEASFTPVLGQPGAQLFRLQAPQVPFLETVDFTATAIVTGTVTPGNPGGPVTTIDFLNYRVGCSCGLATGPDALLWLLLFGLLRRRRD